MTHDYDTAIASLDRDGRLLALMEKIDRSHADAIKQLHAELAELRDEVLALDRIAVGLTGRVDATTVALSNRIESVTRAVCVPRGGLHSVKS